MWDYLTDMSKFKKDLPFYVNDPFTDEQVQRLEQIIAELKQREVNYTRLPDRDEYVGDNWYDPRKVTHMSREMIEFECPKDIEEVMDEIAKPLYEEELHLAHYNYIDYNLEHGDGQYAPSLAPHIDNSEDVVTFNYMLDGNIDWDLYVDGERYTLRKGQAVVFSALNQPHFRPKRKWKEGEFVKIISFDYSPPDDFRFTGEDYALDPFKYPKRRAEFAKAVNTHPKMLAAWKLYNDLGAAEGIAEDTHGVILDEEN